MKISETIRTLASVIAVAVALFLLMALPLFIGIPFIYHNYRVVVDFWFGE